MSVRVTGAKPVDTKLAGIVSAYKAALARNAPDLLEPAILDLAEYPDELPNQHYERTGTLGAGWLEGIPSIEAHGDELSIRQLNVVLYSDTVQTTDQQDPIFAGRWQTTEEVAARQTLTTTARVEQLLDKVTEKVF